MSISGNKFCKNELVIFVLFTDNTILYVIMTSYYYTAKYLGHNPNTNSVKIPHVEKRQIYLLPLSETVGNISFPQFFYTSAQISHCISK